MPLSHETPETTPADPAAGPTAAFRDGAAHGTGRPAKRRRINFACNYCRNRKTRCDEQKPSCTACTAAGVECVTTDRRRPGVEVSRRETQRRSSRASISSLPTPTSSRRFHSPLVSRQNAGLGEDQVDDTASAEIGSPPGGSSTYDRDLRNEPGHIAESNGSVSMTSTWREDEARPTDPGRTKFQGKLPVFIPCRGNNSVEILADWLDLACRRLGLHHRSGLPSSPRNQPPIRRTALMLSSEPCHFPPADISQLLAANFFDGINVLFPLVNRDQCEENIGMALELGPQAFAEARGIAALAQMYAIWAIGFAAEPRLEQGFDPSEYLDYCKTLLGHLVVFNSVENVRAIVLLAICLNSYDDCAGACNTLNIGVSMAMTMGLHQPSSGRRRGIYSRPDAVLDDDERRLLWLGIYAYEKLLSFELSRSSLVHDDDCYPLPVNDFATNTNCETPVSRKVFAVILDLARILGEIGRKSVIVSRKEDNVSGNELQAVIAEKVRTVAESQLLLTRWVEEVPEELRNELQGLMLRHRPTSDMMMGSKICPFASYVAMHYNNALLVLGRNTLLISKEALSTGANIIAKGKPWNHIVRNGQSIAANAARKILRILVETLDSQSTLIFSSWLGVLNAFATLAVHIITHPGSRISSMDFHLMQAATDFLTGAGSRMRNDGMLNSLLQKVDGILAQQAKPPPALLGTHSAPEMESINVMVQDGPQVAQVRSSTNKSNHANNSLSSADAAYNTPEAELLNLNSIISGNNDFGYDALYSAMSILGDEWFPGLPDGMGILSAGSMP